MLQVTWISNEWAASALQFMSLVYLCLKIVANALCIIMQEFLVKSGDRIELMAMLGLFGAVVSACQMYP